MSLQVIILAAGKGTRMRSAMPKVLHTLAGRPLILHVLQRARTLEPAGISVVYGHGGDAVPNAVSDDGIRWVLQQQQNGTGHAVQLALDEGGTDDTVLVMYGDIPLVDVDDLRKLVHLGRDALAILTIHLDQPGSYGRIVRNEDGTINAIVEAGDALPDQLEITEINTGFMAAPRALLVEWLKRVSNDNRQGEFYLTDVVAKAVEDRIAVHGVGTEDPLAVQGINSRIELAAMERQHQRRLAETLMGSGVSLADPARIDVRGTLEAGEDVFIDINLVVEGAVSIGARTRIGPNCVLRDAVIGEDVEIHANSVIDGARIAADCSVGPFARVRPGTELDSGARIGNFVETKNTRIGAGSKINHLSYVGDAIVGRDTNIGAGVITCNYDGANKHQTIIGDGAFIGSDCQLVAPVNVGDHATVGAGTTLTRDAPAWQLTVTRIRQQSFAGWRRPAKKSG
jgi:bifunctional UDP-N-acetylglucosamine pyrophosphorylase / glucosamine-1-phosphate N-acetyltransferase